VPLRCFPFQYLSELESVVTSCLCSPWSSPILSLVTLKFVRWMAVIVLQKTLRADPLARSALNVIELNDMTPDMIASEVGIGPELN
jgi:hypothetical protein